MEKEIHDMSDDELIAFYEECNKQAGIYNISQQAKKILLNSYYGATGSPFFRYYDKRLAQATTLSGQCLIRTVSKKISNFIGVLAEDKNNEENKYVIAGDTDSAYINPYVIYEKFIVNKNVKMNLKQRTDFYDKLCRTIEDKAISPTIAKLTKDINSRENTLRMKREVICAGCEQTGYAGFWVAKKRYALLVDDNEGLRYEKPKLKVMGLSQVQSSTPKICREDLNKATRLMIEEGPVSVRKFISEVETKFMNKSVEEIALPRSVSNVIKYCENDLPIKGTPVQSKAAIYHNMLLKKFNLNQSIDIIRDSDKIKFLYLTQNKYGIDVIGFKDKLPIEFELHKYVDKASHFDKAFKKPLSDMMEACGWSIEESTSIDEFF